MKKHTLVNLTSALYLIAGILLPLNVAKAEVVDSLTTCVNFTTEKERISRDGSCISSKEARANWHLLRTDSSSPKSGEGKTITICSNKENSTYSYKFIRSRCSGRQVRNDYFRSTLLSSAPKILKVSVANSNVVKISLDSGVINNPDAPVAYYTVTTNKGDSKRFFAKSDLNISFDNLNELTSYSFTVTATTVDGTSPVSAPSDAVTTPKYIAPITKVIVPVVAAQVSLLSDDTAAVTIPVGATSVAVAAPSLGNPSISFGAQGAAISATITTSSNPIGGSSTPFTVSGSTKIVDISVTGLSGSATVCLDAPSTARLWHYVGGVWVDITTSHTSSQVCGTTSSFSPFAAEELKDFTVGETGTGGGVIFYSSEIGFSCGPNLTSTCHYLEMAPAGWSANSCDGDWRDPCRLPWSKSAFSTQAIAGIVDEGTSNTSESGLGLGYRNSSSIVLQQGSDASYAAGLARAYNGNGLSDWYLPSLAELHQLQLWRVANNAAFEAIFGLYGYHTVWSSSTRSATEVWYYNLNSNAGSASFGYANKALQDVLIHPIRAF